MTDIKEVRKVKIYFDGACRNIPGSPSPMGIGVHAQLSATEEIEIDEYKGMGTSNIAEWMGLCRALELAREITKLPSPVARRYQFTILGDSQLIVHQFNGVYRIKQKEFDQYYVKAHTLYVQINESGHTVVGVDWIGRDFNNHADVLSKKGLKAGIVKFRGKGVDALDKLKQDKLDGLKKR